MRTNLNREFEEFDRRIGLTDSQRERADTAVKALSGFLRNNIDAVLGEIQVQGSYATGTVIKPLADGDYDIDLVVPLIGLPESPREALAVIYDQLLLSDLYGAKAELREPCVRLKYADAAVGGFHVDIVPVRLSNDSDAPFEAPRIGEGWNPTAPAEFARWCFSQGNDFLQTVRFFKRWRSETSAIKDSVKSIVLQVLLAEALAPDENVENRVYETFRNLLAIVEDLGFPAVVSNPVIPEENLARNWKRTEIDAFKVVLETAVSQSFDACFDQNGASALTGWREIFGSGFPAARVFGSSEDTKQSHKLSFESMGWKSNLPVEPTIRIIGERETFGGGWNEIDSGKSVLPRSANLRFRVEPPHPAGAEIWWRVTNFGKEAENCRSLRGNFQKARGPENKPTGKQDVNHEITAYEGKHHVEAFVVSGGVVRAFSEIFEVSVRALPNKKSYRPRIRS